MIDQLTTNTMKTFTIYFTNANRKIWENGKLVTIGTYKRFLSAKSDIGQYVSDQNTLDGKIITDAEIIPMMIKRWWPNQEFNFVFTERNNK